MIKGKTSTGFEFEIDPRAAKDVRFVKRLAAAQKDGTQWPDVVESALGAEQFDKLCEHITDEDGFQPIDRLIEEFESITEILGKNS